MLKEQSTLVVFAPGWGDPSFVIDVLARRFQKEFPNYDTYVLSYMNRGITRSVLDIAEDHAPVMIVLREAYERLIFIGHSLGGLVGRALQNYVEWDTYISIASPHKGTRLANFSLAQRISPSAADMATLAPTPLPLPRCPSLTISAAFDELLWPQESSQLPGVQDIKIPWTEHVTVATSLRTFYEIYAWLEWDYYAQICPDKVEHHDSCSSSEIPGTCTCRDLNSRGPANGEFPG